MTAPRRQPLTPKLIAWAHFKLALGLGWGHAMFFWPPTSITNQVTDLPTNIMAVLVAAGALVSLAGMWMTLSPHRKRAELGIFVELGGLAFFAAGPIHYLGVQLGFAFGDSFGQRYALAWFSYAMVAAVAVRFASVVPRALRVLWVMDWARKVSEK